ncbi:hypothetical protein BGZ76_004461, partial [Entomortierella beljakovae]
VGVALSRARGDLKKLNLEDSEAVEAFIDQEKPDVVVHCAAERRPDVVEKDPNGAKKLNVQVPGTLADLTNDRGILLIYISTDYVFDGTKPPYDVRDKANPLNTYGQTKYDGELEVKKLNSSAIILRVPILYGATEYNGESAVNALIDSVKDGKPTTMDHYAVRYPTNVADVARVIKDLSCEEKYTKYEICEDIAKVLGTSVDHLTPVDVAPKDGTIEMSRDATQNDDLDFEKMMGELDAMKTDLANRQASRVGRPSNSRSATTDGEPRRTRTRRAPAETQSDVSQQQQQHQGDTISQTSDSQDQIQPRSQVRRTPGPQAILQPDIESDSINSSTSSSGTTSEVKSTQSNETSELSSTIENSGLGRSESRRTPAAPLPPKSAQRSRSISNNSNRTSRTLNGENSEYSAEMANYPENLSASPRDVSTPTFGPSPRKFLRPYPSSPALSTPDSQGGNAPRPPARSNSRNYSKASPSNSPSIEQSPQSSPNGSHGPVIPLRSKSISRLSRSNMNKSDGAQDQSKYSNNQTIAEDPEYTENNSHNQDLDQLRKKVSNNALSRGNENQAGALGPSLLPAESTPPQDNDRRIARDESEGSRPALRKQKSTDPAATYREQQQDNHSKSQSSQRSSPIESAEDASGNQQARERGRATTQEEGSKGMFSWARSRSKSKDASASRQAQENFYNPALAPTRSTSTSGNQRAKSLPRKSSNQNLQANSENWPPYSPGALSNGSTTPNGSSLQSNKSINKGKYSINPPSFGSTTVSAGENPTPQSSSTLHVNTNVNTIHHDKMIRGMGMGGTHISPAVLLTPQPSFPTTSSSSSPLGGSRNMALAMMKQDGSPSPSELQMQQRHQQLQQAQIQQQQQQQQKLTGGQSSTSPPSTPTSPRHIPIGSQNVLSPSAPATQTQRLVATRIYIQTETDFKSLNLAPNSTALDALHMLQQRGTFGEKGDPRYHDRWTIFEYSKEFLIDRPLRDFEVVLDVMKTWEADKDNKMICKSFPARNELTAQELIRLVGPAGKESFVRPFGWVHLEMKKNKWVKRYMHITDTAVYHSKDHKFNGESMLCMLRNFDVYAVQVPRKKAPTKFGFALKSSDSIHMFETPEDDYIHYVCTDSGESLREWLAGLRAAKGMFMYHANPDLVREGQKRAVELMSSGMQEGFVRGNLTDEQVNNPIESTTFNSDLPQGVSPAVLPSNSASASASSELHITPLESPLFGQHSLAEPAPELMSTILAPSHLEENAFISHSNQVSQTQPLVSFTNNSTTLSDTTKESISTTTATDIPNTTTTTTTTTTIDDKMPSASSASSGVSFKNPFMAGSLLQQRVEAEKQEIEILKLQLKMREQAGVLGSRNMNDHNSHYLYSSHGRGLSSTGSTTSLSSSTSNHSLHQYSQQQLQSQSTPKFGGPGTLIEKGEVRAAQLLERSKSAGTGLLRPSNGTGSDQRSRSRSRGPPEDRSHTSEAGSRPHSPGSSPTAPPMPQGPLLHFQDGDAMIQPGLLLSRAKSAKQLGSSPSSQGRSPGVHNASGMPKNRQLSNSSSSHNLVGGTGSSRTRIKPLIDLGNVNTNQDVIGPGLLTNNTQSSSQSTKSPRRNKPLLEF